MEFDYNIGTYRPLISYETFSFEYSNDILYSLDKGWKCPVPNLDKALDKIKQYFAGGNYEIVNLKQGL